MKSGKECVKTCEYANYEKHLHSLLPNPRNLTGKSGFI